jgi:hypothetical protein
MPTHNLKPGAVRAQCGQKRRFRKQYQAEQAAQSIKRNHGDELRAYRCTVCKAWHLGH